MPVRTYSKQEKLERIDQALEMRYERKMNWDEIADTTGVARSTLSAWRKDPEWREADARWRRLLREQARSDAASIVSEMMDGMYELAKTAKSEYVRFMAMKEVIDINQVANEIEETALDQQKELNEFLQRIGRREATAAVVMSQLPVQPGGLLPESIMSANVGYRDRKRAEAEALEAEFREVQNSNSSVGE